MMVKCSGCTILGRLSTGVIIFQEQANAFLPHLNETLYTLVFHVMSALQDLFIVMSAHETNLYDAALSLSSFYFTETIKQAS